MTKRIRRNFSVEFKLEVAQLVIDQGYTHEEAAKTMSALIERINDTHP